MTIFSNNFDSEPGVSTAEIDESGQQHSDNVEIVDGTMLPVHPIQSNLWPSFPNPLKHPLRSSYWTIRSLFGLGVMIFVLAVIAVVPILSLLVLGYLLDVEGRVARSGRFRDGFPLLVSTPRIGTIVLGIGMWLLPLHFVSDMAVEAALIDLSGTSAGRWEFARIVLSVLTACHLCLALARGGSFGCFFRPIKNFRWLLSELKNRPVQKKVRCPRCGDAQKLDATRCLLCETELLVVEKDAEPPILSKENTYWHRADRRIRKFLEPLQIRSRLLLGIRGFLGASVILILPTFLFSVAQSTAGFPVLVTVFGGICLAVVFLYVPFLQANLAAKNQLAAMFELKLIRKMFSRTPFTFFLVLLTVYTLALPLYLFTAFTLPRDALWLLALVFVASIYPARILTGWAYHRAAKKLEDNKNRARSGWIWLCRLLMFATTAAYTLFFFFVRDIGAHGKLVLFEHHAFLGTALSSLVSLFP